MLERKMQWTNATIITLKAYVFWKVAVDTEDMCWLAPAIMDDLATELNNALNIFNDNFGM